MFLPGRCYVCQIKCAGSYFLIYWITDVDQQSVCSLILLSILGKTNAWFLWAFTSTHCPSPLLSSPARSFVPLPPPVSPSSSLIIVLMESKQGHLLLPSASSVLVTFQLNKHEEGSASLNLLTSAFLDSSLLPVCLISWLVCRGNNNIPSCASHLSLSITVSALPLSSSLLPSLQISP